MRRHFKTLSEIFRAAQRVVRARLRTHKADLVPAADRPQRAPHGGFTELPSGMRSDARKQASRPKKHDKCFTRGECQKRGGEVGGDGLKHVSCLNGRGARCSMSGGVSCRVSCVAKARLPRQSRLCSVIRFTARARAWASGGVGRKSCVRCDGLTRRVCRLSASMSAFLFGVRGIVDRRKRKRLPRQPFCVRSLLLSFR